MDSLQVQQLECAEVQLEESLVPFSEESWELCRVRK